MNIVLFDRIIELSETKTKFQKIKEISANWRMVIIISIAALTLKVAAEQLAMLLIRRI